MKKKKGKKKEKEKRKRKAIQLPSAKLQRKRSLL
jgi:hypothetical protein